MIGALSIHENLLPIVLQKMVVIVVANTLAGPYFSSGDQGERRLISLHYWCSWISWGSHFLYTRILAVVFAPFFVVEAPACFEKLQMFQTSKGVLSGAIHKVTSDLASNAFFHTVVLSPFKEEMVCRHGWSLMFPAIVKKAHVTIFGGHTMFAMTSALFFSVLHIANHRDALEKALIGRSIGSEEMIRMCLSKLGFLAGELTISDANMKIYTDALMPGINQITSCFCNTLFSYAPLYETHGVCAYFGAHAAWNLYAYCVPQTECTGISGMVLAFHIGKHLHEQIKKDIVGEKSEEETVEQLTEDGNH